MARGDVRIAVTLACEEWKRRNYQSHKSNARGLTFAAAVAGALLACGAIAWAAVTPIDPNGYHEGCSPQGGVALQGDGADDTINGTAEEDLLRGGDGDDTLNGLGGADCLLGQADDDRVNGGDGADGLLKGGQGDDTVRGGEGDEGSDNPVVGGKGNDKLFGDDGEDTANAGKGDDKVHGGAGPDRLNCGKGKDVAFKQGGDSISGTCEKTKSE